MNLVKGHVEHVLLDYVYGELSAADASGVEAHLRACAHCAGICSEMTGVRRVMGKLPTEAPPAAGLESLLSYAEQAAQREAVPATKKVKWGWGFWVPVASALTFVVVVSSAVLFRGGRIETAAMVVANSPRPAPAPERAYGSAEAMEARAMSAEFDRVTAEEAARPEDPPALAAEPAMPKSMPPPASPTPARMVQASRENNETPPSGAGVGALEGRGAGAGPEAGKLADAAPAGGGRVAQASAQDEGAPLPAQAKAGVAGKTSQPTYEEQQEAVASAGRSKEVWLEAPERRAAPAASSRPPADFAAPMAAEAGRVVERRMVGQTAPSRKQATPGLSPAQIDRWIESYGKNVAAGCASAENLAGRPPHGSISVAWTIRANGSVTEVRVRTPEDQDSALGKCVKKAIEKWIFPEHELEGPSVQRSFKY